MGEGSPYATIQIDRPQEPVQKLKTGVGGEVLR